jgi:CRISPR-associated RAMP protein, csm3 family
MYSKIKITGIINVETGMHVGASDGFSVIGAVDSPVAKDAVSRIPYIPGSSLKGKIRSLVAKAYSDSGIAPEFNKQDDKVTRLFGAGADRNGNHPKPSRLIFSDMIMENIEELKKNGVEDGTEVKEENTINPITAEANPRQIERVVRGAKFPLTIIYNAEKEHEEEMLEDIETLALGLKLLSYDYIGGHGSRGYGRVTIDNINADCVVGDINKKILDKCNELLKRK